MRGRLIAVEGVEGAGKTTLAAAIAGHLEEKGLRVSVFREPGGTALGESIRRILLHSEMDIPARTEVFLFMASRAQLVVEKIIPALSAGRTVVLDRYLLSSVAYQGGAGDLGIEGVIEIGRLAIEGAAPDLTLLLDIDPRQGLGRLSTRRFDRIEKKGLSYHEKVRRSFLDAARIYPWPVVVIDAARPMAQVHEEARRAVDALFEHTRT